MGKRKLIAEMMEGIGAMRAQEEGKITLRSFRHEPAPLPALDSAFIRETRERLRCCCWCGFIRTRCSSWMVSR
jgi:hypothetical protein